MEPTEIDLHVLRGAVDLVLRHMIEDLRIERVRIDESEDHYWDCDAKRRYSIDDAPPGLEVGRLSDDLEFIKSIKREASGASSYNLVHIAPLLRFVGEKIKK